MVRALFGDDEDRSNPQKLKDAAVQLMPDVDGKGGRRVLLNFPLDLDEGRIKERLGKASKWQKQFKSWKSGKQEQLLALRWPEEFVEGDVLGWWKSCGSFRVLAADLGTRNAASVALIECSNQPSAAARRIGVAEGEQWFASFRSGAILRLPGEDARVLPHERGANKKEGKRNAFRIELSGDRGRLATDNECMQTIELVRSLTPAGDERGGDNGKKGLLAGITKPDDLQKRFSFPEQNDKLLVAVRRAQGWIAACISWHWKLSQSESLERREAALEQLRHQERMPGWCDLANDEAGEWSKLRDALFIEIVESRNRVQTSLLELTKRILPLRGRTWEWVSHPDKDDCHLLRQTQDGTGPTEVWLKGQRGLSMARIEQLAELRRRWQSLNQALRRQIGEEPLTASQMRNDPIPDPCPDILHKLENIREQRVNQTANLIIAQALGLKLQVPEMDKKVRRKSDMHGEYRIARPPADFIVLEDLARYLSDQGRARSENSRLMKWCHRAVLNKVKLLAEPFGISVLEAQAAYSSRFCSLTGIAGFRAAEVGWSDRNEFRWRVLLDEAKKAREEGIKASDNAKLAEQLFVQLEEIVKSAKPLRTLLAPQPGGPIFVTAKAISHPAPSLKRKDTADRSVLPMQADLNAAVNLAMRAIAHPASADIHHRLRTERKKGAKGASDTFIAREARRFGKQKVEVVPKLEGGMPKERNPNLFYDPYEVADFGRAQLKLDGEVGFPYVSGPGLWKMVNDRVFQWNRCNEINHCRLSRWEDDGDDIQQ
jgi:hypothetical protein